MACSETPQNGPCSQLRQATGISLNDRFSQLESVPAVRIQISAQHQENAKQKRFAMQMANRQLVVPPVSLV